MNVARRIYRMITTVVLSVVVLLAVMLVGVRLVGLTPYTVISGSMEPTYPVGSLLYVQSVDPTTLQAGDPVTYYMSGGQVVTHRDANNIADNSLLQPAQVIGRPVLAVPLLGYLSWFIQNPPGTYIAIAAVLVVLSLGSLMDLLAPQEGEEKPTEDQPTADEPIPATQEDGE